MLQLKDDPIVEVRVLYAIRSRRLEVTSGTATPDAVLVALQKALYSVLQAAVKVSD